MQTEIELTSLEMRIISASADLYVSDTVRVAVDILDGPDRRWKSRIASGEENEVEEENERKSRRIGRKRLLSAATTARE